MTNLTNKRRLALDVGTKSCGLAATDPLGITIQPITTLRYKGEHDTPRVFKDLCNQIKDLDPIEVVVGLPLNMNGTEGPQAGKVRRFIKGLHNTLKKNEIDPSQMNWVFWDERKTTEQAESFLIEQDVSRAKRKEVIDKMAAVFILQSYLDEVDPQF